MVKQCRTCEVEKPVEGFYRHPSGTLTPSCRECTKARVKEWRSRNMDKAVGYNRNWRKKNADKWHAIKLAKYGLTVEDYKQMLRDQGGVCAICGGSSNDRRLSVDHCHDTGRVRGLLCIKCNSAIGYLPTTDLLESAKRYLSWS